MRKVKLRGAVSLYLPTLVPNLAQLSFQHLTSMSVSALLKLTPDLTSLDLSLTPLKTIPASLPALLPRLVKLHLTGAALPLSAIADLFLSCDAPALEALHIGQRAEAYVYAPGIVPILTQALSRLVCTETNVNGQLKRVSLNGNVAMVGPGWSREAKSDFQDFIECVGRHLIVRHRLGSETLSRLT